MSLISGFNMDTKEKSCLKELRELVKDNRDFEKFSEFLNDRFLLHFIRGKKLKTQEAFNTLKNYISIRQHYSEFFKSFDTKKAVDIILRGLTILKSEDVGGRYVVVLKIALWDTLEFTFQELQTAAIALIEEMWNDESHERKGIVVIYDMEGYNFSHIKALSPSSIKMAISVFLNAYPLRVKGLHFVNMNYLSTLLYKVVGTLLPLKIRNRLNLYTKKNVDKLQEHFSPDILPKFLGGSLSEEDSYMDFHDVAQRIIEKQDYYNKFAELL